MRAVGGGATALELAIRAGGEFNLNFLAGGLDSRITFTRASSGTYFNSAGVMQTATTDVPRFNYLYNGSAWEPAGLLVEPAATNLMNYSEASDNAVWAKTGVTVIANATTAPDGASTADKIVEVAAASTPRLVRGTITVASATAHTFSIFAKSAERTQIRLVMEGSASFSAYFDLSAGTVGSVGGSATASIKPCGNGWYRCILKWTTGSTNANPYIATASAGAVIASGDATKGVFLWGAQLETGSVATSYIPTAGSTATRAADVASITGTNFSSWFNPTEFTAVLEVSPLAACPVGVNQRLLSFSDGTTSNRILIYRTDIGTFLQAKSGGSLGVQTTGAILSPGSTSKIVISCKENNFRMSINGGSVLTDSLGAMPTGIDRMGIGYDVTAAAEGALAHFARLTFYPVGSYSDAALQGLST